MKPIRILVSLTLTAAFLAALVGAPLQFSAVAAPNASTTIVISQVYSGGGASTGTYIYDYVELHNLSAVPQSLENKSLQYGSSTGNFGSYAPNVYIFPAGTTIPSGGYLLLQLGPAGTAGVALPVTADLIYSAGLNMSGPNGKVALANITTALGCGATATPCSLPNINIVDLVAYGNSNNAEGGTTVNNGTPLTTAQGSVRNGSGCTDTDNNNLDFTVTAPPIPRNSSSPKVYCGADFAPTITSTNPADQENSVGLATNITVNFDEPVDVTLGGVTLECPTGTPVILNGLPTTNTMSLVLTPAAALPEFTGCTARVLAANVTDTDTNEPPDNMAGDYTWVFTTTLGDNAPSVVSTDPLTGTVDVPTLSTISITFSELVSLTANAVTLECPSGTPIAFSGLPITNTASVTLTPNAYLPVNTACSANVVATEVNDMDGIGPAQMAADFPFNFTTGSGTCPSCTMIHDIQGSGMASPLIGQTKTIEGIVVGDFQVNASSGYFLQEEENDYDADPLTSEGIFVYSTAPVSVGDQVQVKGVISEHFNETEITPGSAADVTIVSTGTLPAPTSIVLPVIALTDWERYEGMLVKFPQALVISEYYNYDRYGEIVLSLPFEGQSRMFTPTSVVEPGAPATDLALQNSLRRITLDDANSSQNPAILRHPNGLPFSLTNLFRGGDLVQNAVGVLGYEFDLYRIIPTGPADYTATNLRPTSPEAVGGRLQIAVMNTLNYFLTGDNIQEPSGGPDNPADNLCGPAINQECRGFDGNQPLEFTRQRTKLLAALSGLDAAVIGLNEMENTTGVEPLADIVAGLNATLGAGTFAYIDTGTIGTDAIRVGMIYRPGEVTPVGNFALLTTAVDPRFLDTKNRPALAQTFQENSTGARFTVVVNHLKSKGSDCLDVGDPDLGDGQGNCNVTRKNAAMALVDWLATDPTGSGDPDFIIMGDLNSYAMEDPIDAVKAGPDDTLGTADDYTNLIFDYQGLYAYSYVFDGQNGYLDHALSTASMASQITGVVDWHINADEADVVDYDTSFKPVAQEALYEPNAYRASDHDPVVVGLNLNYMLYLPIIWR